MGRKWRHGKGTVVDVTLKVTRRFAARIFLLLLFILVSWSVVEIVLTNPYYLTRYRVVTGKITYEEGNVITEPICSYATPYIKDEEESLYKAAKEMWIDTRGYDSIEHLKAQAVNLVREHGFVLLRGVLEKDKVAKLRTHFARKYGRSKLNFPRLNNPNNRFDVQLDLEDELTRNLLNQSVQKLRAIYEALVGPSAHMVEFSCMFTCDAKEQAVHIDMYQSEKHRSRTYPNGNCPAMYSSFMALQATPKYMGPTGVYPYAYGFSESSDDYNPEEATLATLGAGDVLIYNAGSDHFASANTSKLARMMFYWTFASDTPMPPIGSTFSIKEEYIERIQTITAPVTQVRRCYGNLRPLIRKKLIERTSNEEYTLKKGRILGKKKLSDFPLKKAETI